MNLLPTGEIELKHHERVPADVMKDAEEVYPDIEKWFKSWIDASAVEITIQKALHQYCGWQHNSAVNEWLMNDQYSLDLLHDWTVVLAKNGWMDIYEDYRQFENDESKKMARELYDRAMAYVKKGA